MPVGATMAAATVGSAVIGSSAAKSAAKTEANAATNASNVQQQMYGQTRQDLAPFRDFGASTLSPYAKLLGLSPDGGLAAAPTAPKVGDQNWDAWLKGNPDVVEYWNSTPDAKMSFPDINDFAKTVAQQQGNIRAPVTTYSEGDVADWRSPTAKLIEQLPGYQFMRDQGIQSVNRSLGSRGQTGAQAKGIARFVTGLADSTYGEQVGRLGSAATIGANAAAQTGSIGANYSGQIGGNIVGAGQASAAGTVGSANAINSSLGTAANYAYGNKLLGMYGGGASNSMPSGGWGSSLNDVPGLF